MYLALDNMGKIDYVEMVPYGTITKIESHSEMVAYIFCKNLKCVKVFFLLFFFGVLFLNFIFGFFFICYF